MIRSMTGYGEAELDTRAGRIRAELKTVNHRYFSANLRLPHALDRYEPRIRDWLRAVLPRGHVSFTMRLQRPESDFSGSALRLDTDRARQYVRLLQALKQELQLPGEVDVALVSRFSDLIVPGDDEDASEVEPDEVRAVTEAAAKAAVRMREEEGAKLDDDLVGRLDAIEAALAVVVERAPRRLRAERDRLRTAVAELANQVDVDEERLAREVAYLAERWDISEELVRLRSHIRLFRETLELDAGEPVGKRLGFLNQEMHREANTIGAKANDAEIEHRVVAIKNEIERLREQLENVE